MKKVTMVGAMLVALQVFGQQTEVSEIQEVTLASKVSQNATQSGKEVKVLSQKDLQKFSGKNLADVLQTVAGIQISGVSNNDSEPKTLRIRGGNMGNVLILIDGIPYKDVSGTAYTTADLRLIPLENIDSVEVMNGAASVLYGSNAAASVINIRTKQSFSKKIQGEVGMKLGSFGTFGQHLNLGGKSDNFFYKVSGNNEKSDGISAAEGENFEKDGYEKQNIGAAIGYEKNKLRAEISAGWNHNLYKFDGGAFTDAFYRNNDQALFINLNSSLKHRLGELFLKIGESQTSRLTQDLISQSYEDQYKYKGKNLNADFYNQFIINVLLKFTAGLSYEKQAMACFSKPFSGGGMNEDFSFGDTSATTFAAYGNAQFQKDIFHLDAGLRYSDHSKFGGNTVYSINPFLLKNFEKYYAKIGYSFATAFIAPTLYQNFGSLPYTISNFDLKPQTSENQEINVEFGTNSGSAKISGALFRRNEKDEFVYKILIFNPFYGSYVNEGSDRIQGLEASAFFKVDEKLNFGANYTFVEKTNPEAMLRQPKQKVNSFVSFSPVSGTEISVRHQFTGKKTDIYFDNTTYEQKQITVDSYHIFGLGISQKIWQNISANLVMDNIFNKKYTDLYGYTTKPRNLMFTMNYNF